LAWQEGLASGRGHRVISRRVLAGVTAAALVASLAASPVTAAGATITSPRVVYTGVGQTIAFSGSDDVSSESRVIQVDGAIAGTCNPTSGNDYTITTCGRVQLGLSDIYGGSLRIQGSTKVSTAGGDRYVTPSGAVVENATDPAVAGGPVLGINMNGTLDQLNGALADLEFLPAPGYENSGTNVPNIDILFNDGTTIDSDNEVILRVEGNNGGPTVAGPGLVPAPAGVEAEYPPDPGPGDPEPQLVSVIDPELCRNDPQNICGGAYPSGNPPPESDDQLLLVAWIQEQSCGLFDLRSRSGFTNQGGVDLPSVNAILTASGGLDMAQDAANAVLATLSPAAAGVDLTPQASGLTTVFAGTADLGSIRYALSQVTFDAPPDDATCNLEIAVSDLGNNGMPNEWKPGPGPDTLLDSYEIPDAKADQQVVTFEVQDGQPAVAIDQIAPSQAGDPAGPNKPSGFTITFADPIDPASFDASDLDLSTSSASGAALGALLPVVAGSSYTVPVTASGDGTITLTMADGSACAVGHFSGTCDSGFDTEPATYDDNEITWDGTGPAPAIGVKAGQDNPTGDATVTFEVDAGETFSSAPAGFTGADIDLTASTATTDSPTVTWQGAGSPSMFDVSVHVSSSGDVVAKVMADAYVDTALNSNTESGTATITVDQAAPTVVLAPAAGQADPTSTSPITFTAAFSEDVTGLDASDVSFTGSTAGGTLVANVTGGPAAYDIVVSGMTTSGDVSAAVTPGAAVDAVGNLSAGSNASTVAWDQVTDTTKPDVAIDQAAGQADPTGTASVDFTAVFSEPVSGFDASDIDVTGSTVGGTLAANVTGGPATYTVTVTGMAGEGTVVAAIPADAAMDASGNTSTASTATDNAVSFDGVAPTVTIEQGAGQTDPTSTGPVVFDVLFSEPVTGFATGDVSLGGTSGATTATVTGGPSAYTVTVTGMTTTGPITASVDAGVAQDGVGNPNGASTSADNAVQWNQPPVDTTNPTVTIDQAVGQADPTSTSPITFTAVFSEPVTGFDAFDVAFAGSTAGGTLAAAVSGGPASFTVSVSGMTTSGVVRASIGAGAAEDAAGNPSETSTSTDHDVTWEEPVVDTTSPTVTINQAAAQADPTSTSPITFTVVFSEPVSGFVTGDVTLTGTSGATTATVTGGPATYTVSVTGMSQTGSVTVSVAAGVAEDASANPNEASTSSDATVQWTAPPPPDNIPPTVTVEQAPGQADPAYGTSVKFKVTFSEAVTGFGPEDVILGGTAKPTKAVVSGPATDLAVLAADDAVYTVSVSGMSAKGSVSIAIAAGGVLDLAGNPNAGSTAVDGSVRWLGTRPTPSVSVPPTDVLSDEGALSPAPASLLVVLIGAVLAVAWAPAAILLPRRRRRRP
jgi:hypothetical protein